MSNAITASLQPHQKALLFFALNALQENAETQIATAIINDLDSSVKLFASFTLNEIKGLKKEMFANDLVKDTDFIQYFQQQHSAVHINEQASKTIADKA